jgi:hypothetical protein
MIQITEEKLRAAIQIALVGECENADRTEAKLLHDIKALSIPVVVGQSEQLKCGVLGGVCPYEAGDRLCRAKFKCENQVVF